MGVHGLWELLAPVGRRVSVETLAGKRLAIDASIWIIQFMKAMRDEKGEMVRNAHILGFFRRICKLLYLRTKPVFVFDGGTPALKRRTVIARRRQRENAQAKIRKTAEKLLLNQLKAMKLKELAADLAKQRQANDVKGKRPLIEEPSNEQVMEKVNNDVAVNFNQEELDEMLAASLAAEENERFNVDASASGSGVPGDEVFGDGEDDDDDEEIILPEIHGKVDPAVLASLPPSMQLDLLVQMRERLMAENRQKYQKVKKAPARFSELQIEAYLKTVAFRREIDGVQKSAAGRAIGGMQTSRIASEANREFVFSSSFTGDKEALTSVGQDKVGDDQSQPPPVNCSTNNAHKVSPVKRSGSEVGATRAESEKAFNDDVETYLDERGRLRVSRVRALGIRMTRDLQRNLDLMKEIDKEKAEKIQEENTESNTAKSPIDVIDNSSDRVQNQEIFYKNNVEVDKTNKSAVDGNSIEISFEDSLENEYSNDDDKLFACLVAGEPVMEFSVNDPASLKQSLHSTDCEWEEGIIEDRSTANPYEGSMNDEDEPEWEEGFQDIQMKSSSCQVMSDDGEAEWEEGSQDIQMNISSRPDESQRPVTKGALEEEADFQEAIRRSLEDTTDGGSFYASKRARGMVRQDADSVSINECKEGRDVEGAATDVCEPSGSIFESICSEAKTAAFVELINDTSNIKLKNDTCNIDTMLLNKEDGEGGALDGEILVGSDTVPDEELSVRNQPFDSCTEDGNEHAVNKLVNTCTAEAAADDHSHSTAKLGKISADDSITDVDGTEKLTKEKICDFSTEKQGLMRDQLFVDVNKEHEIMEDHLAEEMLFLGEEREELGSEQRRLERNAESVSSEMFAECQELLQMFGLPYIIAPMEAEAQCAFMELSNLVDGVVTDDSDAFLFGARSVYKNIFDDRKYVETYLMKDMENELGLDREKLILMALLLGSDYTEGISGIGIVNAIEVVNAFPGKDGLREFREWIESPDPTILGKLDVEAGGNSRKKGSKRSENITSGSSSNLEGISSDQNIPQPVDDAERIKQIFMDKHRNVSKNWHVSSSFPSDAVISAYASPQVDKSTESLAWGKPDLFVLRKLCREKFGWGSSKADELLLPVLKEYNKHETQLRLEAFYTFNERFAKIRSKRIKKAVKGITRDKSSDLMDDTTPKSSGSRKKRKANPSEEALDQSGVASTGLDDAGTTSTRSNTKEKPAVNQLKRGRRAKEDTSELNSEKETNATRGRSRGRGRGQVSGRGRKKNYCSAGNENSCAESDHEEQVDISEESPQIRRSGRPRKVVNYTDPDELDNRDKESEDCLEEGSTSKELLLDQEVGPINESIENERNDVEIGGRASIDNIQMDDDPFNKIQLSEDYLRFGGGFCAEEDKETELNKQDASPTREMIWEKDNDGIDLVDENGESKQSVTTTAPGPLDETHHLQDDAENDCGDRCPKSLRAMPNLRRKKRRT